MTETLLTKKRLTKQINKQRILASRKMRVNGYVYTTYNTYSSPREAMWINNQLICKFALALTPEVRNRAYLQMNYARTCDLIPDAVYQHFPLAFTRLGIYIFDRAWAVRVNLWMFVCVSPVCLFALGCLLFGVSYFLYFIRSFVLLAVLFGPVLLFARHVHVRVVHRLHVCMSTTTF